MTITEAVVGMLVLAVAVGGAMQATTVARLEAIAADDRSTARAMLATVAAQLGALPYADPQVATDALGPEAGESASAPSGWDDIDDAEGWTGAPTLASAPSAWTVSVRVEWVNPADPSETRTLESGLKRLTMRARRGERVMLEEVWLRARP